MHCKGYVYTDITEEVNGHAAIGDKELAKGLALFVFCETFDSPYMIVCDIMKLHANAKSVDHFID